MAAPIMHHFCRFLICDGSAVAIALGGRIGITSRSSCDLRLHSYGDFSCYPCGGPTQMTELLAWGPSTRNEELGQQRYKLNFVRKSSHGGVIDAS